MPVRIRLTRFGKRSLPYFHIVVCPQRTGRDRKPIEVLGQFYDRPDERYGNRFRVCMDYPRVKYWIGVGAVPSDTVRLLLGESGILPDVPRGPVVEAPAANKEAA